ncbi:NAD(P)H-binding protein [Thiothrix lacustris]|uniref:NAD(P)H-binding protein n=1 Tax=Thiothrix lacustris TaxID=525917 RepID=A0ABY9MQL4_9GAMM|nr:NAD(P)H-binding protein [Thiothrix lacustris]WML90843.1 NAD(P)H-binding protein [Thiothrix lacustris]WMP17605.1 NAD(P)H-binding protein [Thiothrix lacustris]
MNVSIIGGTGFVGTYLIDALLQAGHTPRVLVRAGSEGKLAAASQCETVSGDIGDNAALDNCLQGTDAVIYLIGILREFPAKGITYEESQFLGVERTVAAAQRQGVKHFILMSANGVKAGGTKYQDTKFRAEQCVQASGLAWTVFRPSVIFGEPRGKMEFCTQLQKELVLPPIPAPLFFGGVNILQAGEFQMQPVHVTDVAQAFVGALDNPAAIGKTFALCGADAVSWKTIIQTLAQASGRSGKLAVPAPAAILKVVAGVLDKQAWFPITRDQIVMLLEGNTCSDNSAWQTFGMTPKRFALENLGYLA